MGYFFVGPCILSSNYLDQGGNVFNGVS